MCGRFTLRRTLEELKNRFPGPPESDSDLPAQRRFNIPPSSDVLTVRNREEADQTEFASLKWGLVPFWSDDPDSYGGMINARSETVHEKSSFKHAFRRRRCLIPADGFYEWKQTSGKQPYFIRMKQDQLFAFAGIWDRWESDEQEEVIESVAILTTEPNRVVSNVHDRMPVILPKNTYRTWLDHSIDDPKTELRSCLESYPADSMEAYPVSKVVNNPENDKEDCVRPIEK